MPTNPLKTSENFSSSEPTLGYSAKTLDINTGTDRRKPLVVVVQKIMDSLFSTRAAGFYILIFAVSIGAATFVENDFGTSSAQKLIYQSRWFELILVLFSISLLVNIHRFRMIKQKKWATLTFHAAMIIILLGSGVTRYFGSEGIMHIREGRASNSFLSDKTYLQFQVITPDRKYVFEEEVQFASLGDNHLKNRYLLGREEIAIEVLDFIPNPREVMVAHDSGTPVLKVVMAGDNGRQGLFY